MHLSDYPLDKCPVSPARNCMFCNGRDLCPDNDKCGQWSAFDRTVSESGGMLQDLNDTKGGRSGGPVWHKVRANRGGRVMVGIHVGFDGTNNVAVRTTPAILADIVGCRRRRRDRPRRRPSV